MNKKGFTLGEIIVFLVLTAILSSLVYIPIIQGQAVIGIEAKYLGLLMLVPGLAAVITYLVFEHSLRPVGWRLGKIKYLLLGLVIPFLYCLLEYAIVWVSGQAKFNGLYPPSLPIFLITMLFNGTLSALLEEVGWRGFLVPEMIKITTFTKTAVITGLIWAIWHYPLIIYSNARYIRTPLGVSLACFTIFVVGFSFVAAWLRLASGSIWPVALLHASHNVFMLHVFNVLTTQSGSIWQLLGEYGVMTAVTGIFLALFFWSARTRLSMKSNSRANAEKFGTRLLPAPLEEKAQLH